MAAGLGLLRLPPAVFWSLTLRELDAALRGLLGPAVRPQLPTRTTLTRLMHDHPDR